MTSTDPVFYVWTDGLLRASTVQLIQASNPRVAAKEYARRTGKACGSQIHVVSQESVESYKVGIEG